jgi:hypothetical protein
MNDLISEWIVYLISDLGKGLISDTVTSFDNYLGKCEDR